MFLVIFQGICVMFLVLFIKDRYVQEDFKKLRVYLDQVCVFKDYWIFFLDVDECFIGKYGCDVYVDCKNIEGFYECICKFGY